MRIDDFVKVLIGRGVRDGTGVPCSIFKPVVNTFAAAAPELSYLAASSEGEAVAIAAGLSTAGRPAFALMQNSGLGNAINPVTSLLGIYGMPVVLLVSHRGEPGKPDEPQHRIVGQITRELAELCQLRTHVLEDDIARFTDELGQALDDGVPSAWIIRKGLLEGGPKPERPDLELKTLATVAEPARRFRARFRREQILEATLPFINSGERPAVISTTGKLSRELYELDDKDHSRDNRFYMVGSMGCAAGFGLGVARATRRKVMVLDGDGAVLMKMGTLATIGALSPENLHHVVVDNGAYESTGSQATVSPFVDLAQVARACGYLMAETVDEVETYRAALDRQLSSRGPTLLRVAVKVGSRPDLGRPTLAPRDGWLRFSRFLGVAA